MSYARRLIEALVREGTVLNPTGSADEYVVTSYRGHGRAVPCRVTLEPVAVQRYIEAIASGSTAVYPDVDPMEAGYRLMTIHFDEAIDAERPPTRALWFEGDEIRTLPLEDWQDDADPLPPGDYAWAMERPGPEGAVHRKG